MSSDLDALLEPDLAPAARAKATADEAGIADEKTTAPKPGERRPHYRLDWRDPQGRHYSQVFLTKKQAKKEAAMLANSGAQPKGIHPI